MRIFHFYLFLASFLLCGTASAAAVAKKNERFFPNFFLRRNKLTANVVGPDIDATVSFSQGNGDTTAGTWIVKINSFDVAGFSETDCPNGLKWHIHALPVDENDTDLLGRCSFDNIGNHFDPTYGCGGASEHIASGTCADLYGEGNVPRTCDPKKDITTCEMGDLNGKMGLIKFQSNRRQVYKDPYITNIKQIEGLSIVFHCGSPRKACGSLS